LQNCVRCWRSCLHRFCIDRDFATWLAGGKAEKIFLLLDPHSGGKSPSQSER
jgi:hypothetical protein